MAEMTDDQVNRVLAENVMGWYPSPNKPDWCVRDNGPESGHPVRAVESWSPSTNRDNLAQVLANLTPEQWRDVQEVLLIVPGNPYDTPKQTMDADHWLLTCDPAIIARAVAVVVSKEQA